MRAMTAISTLVRDAERKVTDYWLGPADPRAYAGLRIGYAVAALCVLVDLWPVRHALLSSSGLFAGAPPDAGALPLNVFRWARSEGAVTGAMLVAAAACVSLALGFAARISAGVVYLWTVSYTLTAPIAVSGFDTILRVVGFVMVIAPQVRTWTVVRRAPEPEAPPPAYGLRLVQWQVMLIYVGTVWLKAPDPFWRNGEAVTYFFMSMFSRFPSPAFAHLAPLGALLTYGTLLIEASVPFLLWLRHTRWLAVFLGASLHVGIALTSELALFSLAILPLYIAFLERHDFERIAGWLRRAPTPSAA